MMPEDIHGEEIGAPEHPAKRRIKGHMGDLLDARPAARPDPLA